METEGKRSLELGNQRDRGGEGEGENRMASGSRELATAGTGGTGWGKSSLTDRVTLMSPRRSRAKAWKNRPRET